VAQLLWYLSACRRKYRLTVRRNTVTLIAPEMDNITVSKCLRCYSLDITPASRPKLRSPSRDETFWLGLKARIMVSTLIWRSKCRSRPVLRPKYRLWCRGDGVNGFFRLRLDLEGLASFNVTVSSSSSSSGVAQDMTSCQRSIQAADKTGRPEGARNTARNVGLHLSRPPTLTHIASITQPCSVVPLSATTQ